MIKRLRQRQRQRQTHTQRDKDKESEKVRQKGETDTITQTNRQRNTIFLNFMYLLVWKHFVDVIDHIKVCTVERVIAGVDLRDGIRSKGK